ncbi:MAG: hypothetical protein V3W18_03505 [candidate division Zixibacteria bacterium]
MRTLTTITSIIVLFTTWAAAGEDFEVLFEGHGDIRSYLYFEQDANYFIDTELNVSVETFRYKRFYFMIDLFKETHMGRKFNSNMVFDPTRAHWSFGFAGRIEMDNYFFEAQMHHDCFHDIDRWGDNSVYWNSPRLGFGSLGYLPKYKYHKPEPDQKSGLWENKLDYYLLVSFFGPRGGSFQKHHDYKFNLNTDIRYRLLRHGRWGGDIEMANLWVLNTDNDIKRQHRLSFNSTFYGNKGVLIVYLRFWPYDDQSIRSRSDHKFAFGIHLGF